MESEKLNPGTKISLSNDYALSHLWVYKIQTVVTITSLAPTTINNKKKWDVTIVICKSSFNLISIQSITL